ncbi:MAG: substrate-binding domain-containing protein [Pirellulales bacterium]|nr:substrate-binding domain-containing protein [Pirellulales bacterium]
MRNVSHCLFASVFLALFGSWTGCRPADGPPTPPKGENPPVVGVCLGNVKNDPRQAQLKADIEAEALRQTHPGLRLTVLEAGDAASQKRNLEKLRNQGVDLIIVSPIDAQAMTDPVAALHDAGVPVIVLDRAVVGDRYSCHIAPDWELIGAAAGRWLAEKLGGKGNIAEIKGPVDSLPADRLHDAFRDRLRDPGYRFVFEGFVDPPRVDGAKLMADALADVERIDAVFAFDDAAARAAHETANTAGRAKDTLFVGVGGLPDEGAKYVAEGVLDASVLVPAGGAEAIDAAVKILSGKKVPKNIVPSPRIVGGG